MFIENKKLFPNLDLISAPQGYPAIHLVRELVMTGITSEQHWS